MYVSCSLHIAQDIILEIPHGFEWVWYILVLLYVSNDICGLGSFCKVNEIRAFDDGGNAVFDEGKVGEVDAC